MKKKPHSLDVALSYKIGKNGAKRLGSSKVEGWYVISNNKTEVRLPMRSFVQGFLTKLHNIFDGTTASTEISSADNTGSLAGKAGILVGSSGANPTVITMTDLDDQITDASCTIGALTYVAPFASTAAILKAICRAVFTNSKATEVEIHEVALKTHKTASTASNAGNVLMTHDHMYPTPEIIDAGTSTQIELQLNATRSTNGGVTLNFMRILYNLFLKGSANSSAFKPRSGTVTVVHPSASATSHFVLDGAAAKQWGILVGSGDPDYYGADEFEFPLRTSGLTYGANTISAVTIAGSRAYFRITRDITNSGTSNIPIEYIGLVTKGATADPSAIANDSILLSTDYLDENYVMLAPNQTIRCQYEISIQV